MDVVETNSNVLTDLAAFLEDTFVTVIMTVKIIQTKPTAEIHASQEDLHVLLVEPLEPAPRIQLGQQ